MRGAVLLVAVFLTGLATAAAMTEAGPMQASTSQISATTSSATLDDLDDSGPDATLVTVHPLDSTAVTFVVPEDGVVRFAARMGSGAVVGSVEATGLGECDGTLVRGTQIVVGNVYMTTRGLNDCGWLSAGPHTLVLRGSTSATTLHLFIEGAFWAGS